MNRLLFLTALLSLCSLVPLGQKSMAQSTSPELPEALQVLADRGAQSRYLGKKHGMDGWVTILKGQEQYYYVTPDGKGFIMGLLFSQDGTMETVNQVRELQLKSGDALDILAVNQNKDDLSLKKAKEIADKEFEYKTPAERMFADVENSNWIGFGSEDAPVIYSFMDPQCPHCHSFMKDLRNGYLDKNLVQVRMVPVGFTEQTLAQAAFLLAAPDSKERWYKHLDGDEKALPIAASTNTQGIQKNLSLMQAWKFDVTPMTVYRGKDGKIKIMRGRAADINKILADLPPS